MREGACGKRTAETPKPRPQAYLTLHPERPIPVVSAPQQPTFVQYQMTVEKALTRNRSIGYARVLSDSVYH